eukprot:PITA_11097
MQGEDTVRKKDLEQIITSSPPFPKRLIIPRPIEYPDFDLLGELKNICIKIPLLQAIQDILIYAKTIKELCIKKSMRKKKITPTVHVVKTLSNLLLGKETLVKYEDTGNPIVAVQINSRSFPNALVDLGATINILTTTTCEMLGITALEPTTTLLELADHSLIKPEGTLPDVMVSVDTWEYLAKLFIINPRNRLDGHPLILGRPWLATVDAYISCRTANALEFKNQTKDDVINTSINHPATVSNLRCHMIKAVLDNGIEEYSLRDINDQPIPTTTVYNSKPIEIEEVKILNINSNLSSDQQQKLIQVLRKYKGDFAWDYPYMKGFDPQ